MKITKSDLRKIISESFLSESTYIDDKGNLRDASTGMIIEPDTPGTAGYTTPTKFGKVPYEDSALVQKDYEIELAQRDEDAKKFVKRTETIANLLLVSGGIAASIMKAPLLAAIAIGILGGATTMRDSFKVFVKAFTKPGGKIKLAQVSDDVAEAFALDDEILEVLHPDLINQTIDIYEREIIDPAREDGMGLKDIVSLKDYLKKTLKELSAGNVVIVS